ncbi:MAG: ParB/RepB/Spo0J family partition protein, partial [Patescibacteria group bacterium]
AGAAEHAGLHLGRGLGSLIPSKVGSRQADGSPVLVPNDQLRELPVRLLEANPHQPRQTFDRDALEDLVRSIKVHGIIQPLVVMPDGERYQVIAGERRLRAARLAGLQQVPVVVRTASEQEKLELALVENVQRQSLDPIERARGFQRLADEFNLTQEAVAQKVGQSRAAVANALRLLQLPEHMQQALREGTITEGHAKVLLSVKSEAERQRIFTEVTQRKASVRDTEQVARQVAVRRHTRRVSADANLQAVTDAMQQALGTKVEVSRRGERGVIRIRFYSTEELREIIRKITGE